jgi:RHS protein
MPNLTRSHALNAKGQVTSQYLYLNGQPYAKLDSATVNDGDGNRRTTPARLLYLHTDHRGLPLAMTDEAQQLVWRARTQSSPDTPARLQRVAAGTVRQAGDTQDSTASTSATSSPAPDLQAWGSLGHIEAPAHPASAPQKLLYTVSFGLWGKTDQAPAQLDLRLPGQVLDEETGLHYNYQRYYDARQSLKVAETAQTNPHHGRYLSPDPLGFPDGADAYAYVNGDPINKVDPLGLYEQDVHYYMTYFMALILGMSAADAQTMALAAQFIDDNSYTEPLNLNPFSSGTHYNRLLRYHFTLWSPQTDYTALNQNVIYSNDANIYNNLAQSQQLIALRSYAMPNVGLNACPLPSDESLQFMGEFMHAFEDTFSHRDTDNVPISIGLLGQEHLVYGENPDYTYNHQPTNSTFNGGPQVPIGPYWGTNEARTYGMEVSIYEQIQSFLTKQSFYLSGRANSANVISIKDPKLIEALKAFNATNETGLNIPNKLKLLNDYLSTLKPKLGPIDPYDKALACQKRASNLSGLVQTNYPAAILGQKC